MYWYITLVKTIFNPPSHSENMSNNRLTCLRTRLSPVSPHTAHNLTTTNVALTIIAPRDAHHRIISSHPLIILNNPIDAQSSCSRINRWRVIPCQFSSHILDSQALLGPNRLMLNVYTAQFYIPPRTLWPFNPTWTVGHTLSPPQTHHLTSRVTSDSCRRSHQISHTDMIFSFFNCFVASTYVMIPEHPKSHPYIAFLSVARF